MLTSERLFGVKINDIPALGASGLDRGRLARNSSELILQEIFKDGFFHADPHPGNFFALPGEVIGVVDFGQVVTLDRELTDNLLLLLIALTHDDANGALRAMQRMGMLAPREISSSLRRDMMRLMERFVDRPLEELSARETGEELLALARRHHLRMPAPLALLLKAIVMMEGIGLQLDPRLDIFAIARPYATRALADLAAPEVLARRALEQARELGDIAVALPRQVNEVLRQLSDGELHIQTRELEARRIAAALGLASTRVAMALVFLGLILGLGLLGIASALGGWSGTFLLALGIIGGLAAFVTGLALFFNIAWRGRE